MPDLSRLRLIRGQGGSTLIELLVAMPLAVALLGLVSQAFVTGSQDQRRLERRAAALNQAHQGLERMTRELRQANWVYFTSSQIVDAEAMVRSTATSKAVRRHIRYDCSAGVCLRHEGPPVAFPPAVGSVWDHTQRLIGSDPTDDLQFDGVVLGRNIFVPRRVNPTTGAAEIDYLDPDLIHIQLKLRVRGLSRPLEIADGVSLRNSTSYAE